MSAKKTAAGTEETKKEETAVSEKEVAGSRTENPGRKETVVYVGPTITGVATHNQIFNNGLPDGLKEAIKKEPAIASLIVPISELAATNQSINTKTGAAYVFYSRVLKNKLV